MRWLHPLLLVVAVLVLVSVGCAKGQFGPSISTPVSPAPRSIDELSVGERRALLRRAQVWRPIDTASLNLFIGPDAPDAFPFDANVTCAYNFPKKPLTGMTPKFQCALGPDEVVKVKYGKSNGEVYAEVAATRLFWALGFLVDRMYPVRVVCRNCPKDPFTESRAEWHLGKSGLVSDQHFDPAIIERPFPGEEVEVKGFEGWSWPELEQVDEEDGGAPRAQIDALKLLAVFVQHVDTKPDQQAIICEQTHLAKDGQGNATCEQPLLAVKDLGSTFGGAKRFHYDKMKLDSWSKVPVWRNKATCEGDLVKSVLGNLENPRVSEAGRRFLADRLMLLSDEQIRDLFRASRVERRGDSVDAWVRVFKEKREQIVHHTCPV